MHTIKVENKSKNMVEEGGQRFPPLSTVEHITVSVYQYKLIKSNKNLKVTRLNKEQETQEPKKEEPVKQEPIKQEETELKEPVQQKTSQEEVKPEEKSTCPYCDKYKGKNVKMHILSQHPEKLEEYKASLKEGGSEQ